jgi:hypothetical protein
MHSIKLSFLELFEHTKHIKAGSQQGSILLPLFEHKKLLQKQFSRNQYFTIAVVKLSCSQAKTGLHMAVVNQPIIPISLVSAQLQILSLKTV